MGERPALRAGRPGLRRQDRERLLRAARAATAVWDFDGVLGDTEPLHRNSYLALAEAMGNPVDGVDFRRYTGHGDLDTWALMAADGFRVTLPEAELLARREALVREWALLLPPSWPAAVLSGLLEGTCRRQVVVSNGQPAVIAGLLGRWGLDRRLEVLDVPGHPGGKAGLLAELWGAGPTVTLEDNPGWLRLAGEAGSWRVAVRHSENRGVELPAELEVPVAMPSGGQGFRP